MRDVVEYMLAGLAKSLKVPREIIFPVEVENIITHKGNKIRRLVSKVHNK